MSTEAMKLALEALEETRNALAWFYDSYPQDVTKKGNKLLPHVETVLTTLREALAQPQQEPVACVSSESFTGQPVTVSDIITCSLPVGTPLYTSPPARKPLTDEETKLLWHKARFCMGSNRWTVFKNLIEAKHGIKENT